MISLSALLLWRRCIICPSSESQGRVAGWSLWRFMAPSLALIASSSPASLGRPRQSCDQCGGPPTGGSDQKAVRWTPLGRQMAPWTDDKQRPRQKQRGDVWLMVWVRTLTWLSQREKESKKEELWELWLHCWPSIVEECCNEVVRGRNIWSHSIIFVMTSPKPETYFGLQRVPVSIPSQHKLSVETPRDLCWVRLLDGIFCWYQPKRQQISSVMWVVELMSHHPVSMTEPTPRNLFTEPLSPLLFIFRAAS